MVGHERSLRAPRRRPRARGRAGGSELGWVAALLVVAVIVAIASVGGPIIEVLAGDGSFPR